MLIPTSPSDPNLSEAISVWVREYKGSSQTVSINANSYYSIVRNVGTYGSYFGTYEEDEIPNISVGFREDTYYYWNTFIMQKSSLDSEKFEHFFEE